jgi:hypothetical protein
MSRLLLHIGVHKTGTTSIQHALHAYADPSLHQDFYYPQNLPLLAVHTSQHSELAFAVQEGRVDDIEAFFAHVLRNARRKGSRTVVLSGEVFSLLTRSEIALFGNRAAACFDEVKICAMTRDLFEHCRSLVQQSMKGANSAVTPATFARALNELDPEALVANWASVFAACDMMRIELPRNADAVELFFDAVGLDRPEHSFRHNTSMDFATASLLGTLEKGKEFSARILQQEYERTFRPNRYEFASERQFWSEMMPNLAADLRGRIERSPAYRSWLERHDAGAADPLDYLQDLRTYIDRLISATDAGLHEQGEADKTEGFRRQVPSAVADMIPAPLRKMLKACLARRGTTRR